ncbi:desulfoferrodoxin FeS4 iron-binding domain-containing protein [bacterium]|nr:desulfoferrodoxin FeS4 iron-binding domain-containing protein [bacterium]
MTKRLEMYRCEVCGNLVEVLVEGVGELVCCEQPMKLLQPKSKESEGLEKHVPIFELKEDGSLEICVGSVPHPMSEEHYIMFIQATSEDKNRVVIEYLYPTMEPKMLLKNNSGKICAREYCNIHGLWENTSD